MVCLCHHARLGVGCASLDDLILLACLPLCLTSGAHAGKLFVCDYTGIAYNGKPAVWSLPSTIDGGLEAGNGSARRVLPQPLAFFYWDSDRDCLLPIGIKLDASKPSARVYTPEDPEHDWLFAKICVQIADFNHHELSTHLGRTHLAMEPFAVSTQRTMPPGHPVTLLLTAHTRFMIQNNDLALGLLLGKKGPIDTLLCVSQAILCLQVSSVQRTDERRCDFYVSA